MIEENNALALASVSVVNLYGYMTCSYLFDCHQPISILLGPNGSGKTTILNLINIAFNGGTPAEEATIFSEPIFQEMTLEFSDRGPEPIRIKFLATKKAADGKKKLSSISVKIGRRRLKRVSPKTFKTISDILNETLRGEDSFIEAPSLQFISANRIVGQESQEKFSNIFSSLLDVSTFNSDQKKQFLSDYKTSSGGARISNEFNDAIVKINNKMQSYHDRIYDESEKQAIVNWFLTAYLTSGSNVGLSSLRSLLVESRKANLISKQNLAFANDLLAASSLQPWSFFEKNKDVFTQTFFAYRRNYGRFKGSRSIDTRTELNDIPPVFSDFFTPLFAFYLHHYGFNFRTISEIFKDLSGWHDCFASLVSVFQDAFPNYHPLLLHYDYGNGFIVSRRGSKDRFDIDHLSSGQLNSLIMFFDLLKPTPATSLSYSYIYLIDEPEISLHISWQQDYVDELLKLAKKNTQFIIATHSPFILSSHKELLATVHD